MGVIDNIRSLLGIEKRATFSLRDPALVTLFGGHGSDAGVVVTEATSLQSSPVWAAIRVISETVGSLPLMLYERSADGRSRKLATEHPLYELLYCMPHPEIPAMLWSETLMGHALAYGNAYAEVCRHPETGEILSLPILRPDWMAPRRTDEGELIYEYRHPRTGNHIYRPSEIFHLRGLGFDGLVGYSVIRMARESIGLTMAAERFGAKFFGAGARPSGVLTHPGRLSDDARGRLRQDFERLHQGVNNSHRVAILEEGMKWDALGVPPEDAQFLQTRTFQLQEVARWFNLPIGKLRGAGQSYASMEAENLVFLTETLRPWLIRIEQEIYAKLLNNIERRIYFAEHRIDDLLRADQTARYNAYAIGRNWGWLSVNEIRSREGLDPIQGGDEYLQPLNMQPIQAPLGPSAPTSSPAVGTVPPAVTPATSGEPPLEAEANDLATIDESTVRLAEQMTQHQIAACEHGKTNRCRICGIERERVLIPTDGVGGEHSWGIKWRPIGHKPETQP
jgi:HK97 family phage portal protein